jgi:hypothetical protein
MVRPERFELCTLHLQRNNEARKRSLERKRVCTVRMLDVYRKAHPHAKAD